jgi:acyl-CoA synthetase (AMP-forming)/AMP-acid ligase II
MSDMSSGSPFAELDMQGADMQPLSPVHFINRVAYVFATKTAIAYGARRISYGEFGKRCKQLAAAIIGSGIAPQTTVSGLMSECAGNAGIAFCRADDRRGSEHNQYTARCQDNCNHS